jgi:hypothetical protein
MLNGYCALNFFESHLAHHYRYMCEIHPSPPVESRVRVGGLFVFSKSQNENARICGGTSAG